jgi:pimeloyl-ACP methyl ester carboxylesterase
MLAVDHRPMLPRVTCPTLVIAGEKDRVVPVASQREMAGLLPRSEFVLSQGFGHFHVMEDPDFHSHVDRFIQGLADS